MIVAPVACLVLAVSSALFFSVISAIFFFWSLLDSRARGLAVHGVRSNRLNVDVGDLGTLRVGSRRLGLGSRRGGRAAAWLARVAGGVAGGFVGGCAGGVACASAEPAASTLTTLITIRSFNALMN